MASGRQGSKLLASVLVGVVVSTGSYVALSKPTLRYALSVDQAWAKGEHRLGRPLRLQGMLVPGSLKGRARRRW
jgi:hypothetical protein